jgi:SAM-dependent methyltransferase
VARGVREPLAWLATVAGRWPPRHDRARYQQQRADYAAALADGADRFLEPRRDTCPWCGAGAASLAVLLRSGDVLQRKPGRFTLERCAACGHVFQNPRLTVEGLAFYYRDFYDGAGEAQMDYVFASCTREYRGRAELLKPFTTPVAWLDVGTGHGHFCNHARDLWPDTVFDGLDLSASVEEAARRGWIDHAYRGRFCELAAALAGRYDVISMHHYLEHTREPLEELDAAAKALPPGGFLLIELPNPASRYGRLLGWRWMPWFQPQHQHLIPLENLQRALLERGLAPVAVDRGRANQPIDLLFAGLLTVNACCPDPWLPWTASQPTWPRRCLRAALLAAAVPFLLLAAALDRAVHLLVRSGPGGNAYRVLAQKDSA